ncbi:MAG: PepSY-like domain-containing protein [Bacteroidales bacterium]|nr:PepSY-like domain-containing protein [Bacteroidales bacterium]
MKNLVLIVGAFVIISFGARGQTVKDVPAKVQTAFSEKFPDATKVKWTKENDTEWEAEFILNGKEYSANYTNSGTWMETEYEVNPSNLPAVVKATLDKEYAAYKIVESELSETTSGIIYEFGLKKCEEEIEVTISPDGIIIQKEKMEEDDEEDND